MVEKEFCLACGGKHEPDPDDAWVIFRGYRFKKPFRCICCGKEICMRQFAFGRACGVCDMGGCDIHNPVYRKDWAHDHPDWWHMDGREMFKRFVKTVGATFEPIEVAGP